MLRRFLVLLVLLGKGSRGLIPSYSELVDHALGSDLISSQEIGIGNDNYELKKGRELWHEIEHL